MKAVQGEALVAVQAQWVLEALVCRWSQARGGLGLGL